MYVSCTSHLGVKATSRPHFVGEGSEAQAPCPGPKPSRSQRQNSNGRTELTAEELASLQPQGLAHRRVQ